MKAAAIPRLHLIFFILPNCKKARKSFVRKLKRNWKATIRNTAQSSKVFFGGSDTVPTVEINPKNRRIKTYRGDGISVGLFYEGKVAEAVSLIVESQKKSKKIEQHLSIQDIAALKNVTTYLNDHYAFEIPLERLAQIACMETMKLKTTFKQFHNCTVTEYIQQRRMSQAEHLLAKTDLTIGQVAQTVGYSTSSRFAELFRKSTGILPGEYRKITKQN